MLTLADIHEGESALVVQILNKCDMKQRLYDLGFADGSCVECVRRRSNGGMAAFAVRGAVIALREAQSRCVTVTLC